MGDAGMADNDEKSHPGEEPLDGDSQRPATAMHRESDGVGSMLRTVLTCYQLILALQLANSRSSGTSSLVWLDERRLS